MPLTVSYDFNAYCLCSESPTHSITIQNPTETRFAVAVVYCSELKEFYLTTPEKFLESVFLEIDTHYAADDEEIADLYADLCTNSTFEFIGNDGFTYNVSKTLWAFECGIPQYELYEFLLHPKHLNISY
jgi:hypothetical protein